MPRHGQTIAYRDIEKPGGWYHVIARGNERKGIFQDDADRHHFLKLMAEIVRRFRVRLRCFVNTG